MYDGRPSPAQAAEEGAKQGWRLRGIPCSNMLNLSMDLKPLRDAMHRRGRRRRGMVANIAGRSCSYRCMKLANADNVTACRDQWRCGGQLMNDC